MVRERAELLTRAKVIQLGFLVLGLGGLGYGFFRVLGLDGASSGIASEALLVVVVVAWIVTYLFRVVTGKMTFMEQRKRYRQAYEELTTAELQDRFDSLSEEEKTRLLKELEIEKDTL